MADATRPTHRDLIERIVIEGTLVLDTPAQFGSGDAAPTTDMALMVDELDQAPLLPGPSIAGALRGYLTERELGYAALPEKKHGKPEKRCGAAAELLLGGSQADPNGAQSPLIVHDALGTDAGRELRDGVKIDPETRTAKDEARYDMEVLSAGARFALRFELLVSHDAPRDDLLRAVLTALHALESGEITLGRRKRRGFGQCHVEGWRIWAYRLDQPTGLLAWLSENHPDWLANRPRAEEPAAIATAFGGQVSLLDDARRRLEIRATFAIESSLLVRSGFGQADSGPDVVHLHSARPTKNGGALRVPVLPGTSLGGALRARARRILLTLNPNAFEGAMRMLDDLFGPDQVQRGAAYAWASRLETRESVIEGGRSAVQNRIRIDRFTGGAYESALFNEAALFGAETARVELVLAIRNPSPAEIGLALLLIKDLWTGDLPLGGGANIGRGRLAGLEAAIALGDACWHFRRAAPAGANQEPVLDPNRLEFSQGKPEDLEAYVAALAGEMGA